MHKASDPGDNSDASYVPRKEGGRGFASIEERIDILIRRLEDNIKKRLISYNTNNARINKKITKKTKLGRRAIL